MKVECALGDVVDKVTILRLKEERITDHLARADVQQELRGLLAAWSAEGHPPVEELEDYDQLALVNRQLWDVEDALRMYERDGDFGERFVELARSVYQLNDRRASLKRQINHALGSRLIEHKSYGA